MLMAIVVLPTPPFGLKITTIWPRCAMAEDETPTSPSRMAPRVESPSASDRMSIVSARISIASTRQRNEAAE